MSIINTISNLPLFNHWAYWILLLIIILETFPMFGLFIPGQIIAAFGGFLAKLGILNIWAVISVCALGAITGDMVGYFLGKRYGHSFFLKYGRHLHLKKEHYEKTKRLVNNHAGKTIVFGRFNSLTRSFIPLIAGITGLNFLKFLFYNILGGISWAACFVLIGYFFGKGYEVISRSLGLFIFIAIVLSLLIIYFYKYINKKKNVFAKSNLSTLILNIFSLYIFTKMLEDVIDTEMVVKLDMWLSQNIIFYWNPLLNKIMIFITNIANPISLSIFSIFLFGFLIYKKRHSDSMLLLFSLSGGLFFELLTKALVHRLRPENGLVAASGYSFPSGHAMMSIIFFSLLIYLYKDKIKNIFLRKSFVSVCIVLFLSIGLSRIYLNVHWFSDVIAGLSFGLFWVTLLILIFAFVRTKSNKIHLQLPKHATKQ